MEPVEHPRLFTTVLLVFFLLCYFTAMLIAPLKLLEVRTYVELELRRVLLAEPSPLVSSVAEAALASAAAERLVYRKAILRVTPGAAAEIRYHCPPGARIRVLTEPELELVAHSASDSGVCATVLRNNRAELVEVVVLVYSDGRELINDEAFKTYAVLRWVSENLRYIPDPNGSDIIFAPDETIKRGGGDCEDMSLATAALLRALGVSAGVALVNTGRSLVADHVAVAVKPSSPTFLSDLKAYFGASAVLCDPVVVKGYVILDPVLGISSITPWCVPYSREDLRSIVSDEYVPLWRELSRFSARRA